MELPASAVLDKMATQVAELSRRLAIADATIDYLNQQIASMTQAVAPITQPPWTTVEPDGTLGTDDPDTPDSGF